MTVLVSAICRSTESSLQRETIYQVEFAPHYNSGRALTSLLHDKVAAGEAEILRILAKKKRVDALFQSISFLVRAAVHEKILGATMAVVVAIEEDVARILGLSHHDLCSKVFWTLFHGGTLPLTI